MYSAVSSIYSCLATAYFCFVQVVVRHSLANDVEKALSRECLYSEATRWWMPECSYGCGSKLLFEQSIIISDSEICDKRWLWNWYPMQFKMYLQILLCISSWDQLMWNQFQSLQISEFCRTKFWNMMHFSKKGGIQAV